MIPLATLKATVQQGLRLVARANDIREAEVYASSTGQLLCRLNYTSNIPCHGVEEPKSTESYGLGIRAVFTGADGPRIGFGCEARDLSLHGLKRALEKARANAVHDPEFVSLPTPIPESGKTAKRLARAADRLILDLPDSALLKAGWQVIEAALTAFQASEPLARLAGAREWIKQLGLIVGGDVTFHQQRMAVVSTLMPKVQTDETTLVSSYVTSMVEQFNAKGSGYAATTHLAKFTGEAGAEAARNAIRSAGGQRLPSGSYTVVLGPQPVSDLMNNLILPSLSADAFYSSRSAFLGHLGRPVACDLLSIYDHGAARGLAGSKGTTCEGLPTGRTDLIKEGVLRGLLSNHYETQRLLRDPRAREKLGVNPQDHPEALVPRNGFRLSARGGRSFEVTPTIAATNVCIEGAVPHTTESLFRLVGNGVYIGRIWYTYAINGLRAGDFTCTVVGDSYLIQDGRLGAPLQANAIRITGNIRRFLKNILGITKQSRPIIGWAADEVVYAPDIAVRELQLSEIAQYMQSV